MSENHQSNSRPQFLRPFTGFAGRAVSTTLRPVAGMIGAAAGTGVSLERRAVDRLLDSDELGRVLNLAVENQRIQAAVQHSLAGDGAARLVDSLFDSGLIDRFLTRLVETGAIDRFLNRLLADDALWRVVDEIAASPAVTAAISQQGLGFADQVGDEVRTRSRKADDWLERAARRLAHRPPTTLPPEPEPGI